MSLLVPDCPRCRTQKITFYVTQDTPLDTDGNVWEAFCVCQHCFRATIFELVESGRLPAGVSSGPPSRMHGSVNLNYHVRRYVSDADVKARPAPEHLPPEIAAAFGDGAKCLAIDCFNAAAAMFRLALDIATRDLLPADDAEPLDKRARRFLAPRLAWLFENDKLPKGLQDLASIVKDDGNDGAHDGTIDRETAEDLIDFAERLLTHICTEPAKIKIAKKRVAARKAQGTRSS